MKKIFTLFAALAMVMSMSARVVYLQLNDNWASAEADYYVHAWEGENSNTSIKMDKVEGETNLYSIELGTCSKVIFLRHKPGSTVNNGNKWTWDNDQDHGTLWNRFGDLTIPAEANCCRLNDGEWTVESAADSKVTWLTYPFVTPVYKDITIEVQSNAYFKDAPKIMWFGANGIENSANPQEMIKGDYNRYSYTFNQIDSVTGISFYFVFDGFQTKTITVHETPKSRYTLYQILQEVYVKGSFNEWSGVQLTEQSKDYKTVSGVVQLEANKDYEFKITVDNNWFGNKNNITKEENISVFDVNGDNATIKSELAGGYIFTYNYISKELTVTYPYVGTLDLGQMTPSFDTDLTLLSDEEGNYIYLYNVNEEGERLYGENIEVEAVVTHNGARMEVTGVASWTLQEDGSIALSATNLTDENNTVTYTITATCPAPKEYTISATGEYDVEAGWQGPVWTYTGTTEDETEITIQISTSPRGTSIDVFIGDITATATTYEVEEDDDAVQTITLTATAGNGDTYHITMVATPIPVTPLVIWDATAEFTEYSLILSATWKEQTLICEIYGYEEGVEEYESVYIFNEDYTLGWNSNGPVSLTVDGEEYTLNGVFKDEASGATYNLTLTTESEVASAIEVTCNNLETAEDEGSLSVLGYTTSWSTWFDLKILNYNGYGYYEEVNGTYAEGDNEYEVTGTGEIYYDEDLETEVFEGVLSDGTNTYIVTLLNEASDIDVEPWEVVVTNATFTIDKNEYLWITCKWNDGEVEHDLKFECAEGLMYGKEYKEVVMLIDGGILEGGLMAMGTPTITKEGNDAIMTGTFTSTFTPDVYNVTISGVAPEGTSTGVENLTTTVAPAKVIKNAQLVIIKNGVQYNATGAVVK